MKRHVFVILLICIVCHTIAKENQKSESEKRLIYGTDNRVEPHTISDTNLLNLIQADVAITTSSSVQKSGSTWNIVSYGSFTSQGSCALCTSERFYGQTEVAFCSGFLVSSNQIITAGHCVDGRNAKQMAFIFDFKQQSSVSGPQMSGISDDNVYFGSYYNYTLDATADWAVVTLNRTVVGRTPLPIRRSGNPTVGTSLILIGHPSGMTMKVAPGATIQSWSSGGSTFSANCDSYGGNSGSMIVNAGTFEVEGILVAGQTDYVQNGTCCVSSVCPDTGCPGWEFITKISYPAGLIPQGPAVSPSVTPTSPPSSSPSISPGTSQSTTPSRSPSTSLGAIPPTPSSSPADQQSSSNSTDSGSGGLGGLRGTARIIVAAAVVAVVFAAVVGVVTWLVIRRRRKNAIVYPRYDYDDNSSNSPTVQAGGGPLPVMPLSDIQNTKMKVIDPSAPPGGFTKGMRVQARYTGDGKFYGALIIDYDPGTNQFLVQYPDYDNHQEWLLQTFLRKE